MVHCKHNGAYNTAVGYKAFNANTTGTDNTAVGSDALNANMEIINAVGGLNALE